MTPVVLTVVIAVAAALVVVLLAAVVTGTRLPAPRDVLGSVRSGLERPRELFTAEARPQDDEPGRVEDVFVVGRPTASDYVEADGIAHAVDRATSAVRTLRR